MLLRPDGFRGCLLQMRLYGEMMSGPPLHRMPWTTREGRRFLWTHVAAERCQGMFFADEAARGVRG